MSKEMHTQGRQLTEYRPRLPYHPGMQDKLGISSGDWNVLVDTVFPAAKTAGAVALAISYCKARRLDPFKRVVHIVPIYDKERGMMVETVWPGIAEHRTTASRTGVYAGHDEVVFGPDVTRSWQDGDRELTITFPEWAQMTVYRIVKDQRCAFPGPKVRWIETYASKKNDAPNQMWADRPYGMLEKCAEASALRGAFPEELGDEPSEVEASGRNWHGRPAIDVNEQTTASLSRSEAVVPAITTQKPDVVDQHREEETVDTVEQTQPEQSCDDEPSRDAAAYNAEEVEFWLADLTSLDTIIKLNGAKSAIPQHWSDDDKTKATNTIDSMIETIRASRGGKGNQTNKEFFYK